MLLLLYNYNIKQGEQMKTINFYKANKQSTFTRPGDVIAITYGNYDTDVVFNLTTGENYTLGTEYEEAQQIKHSSYPLYEREQENLKKYKLDLDWNLLG